MAGRKDLRDAAATALGTVDADPAADSRLERAILEIRIGGRTELVTVSLRDGAAVCTCSDGTNEGPHVTEALRLLAAGTSSSTRAGSVAPGQVRTISESLPAKPDRPALSEALDDLLTAVVRVGVADADGAPTVEATLERLLATAPSPVPLGISRWLGLLRTGLSSEDVDLVARTLAGASRLASDLRAASPSPSSQRRIAAWLGATVDVRGDVERVSDRVLAEVAREYLQSGTRHPVERRYLICLDSGEIYREDRARGSTPVSVGPCPRLVTVGLGEIEDGPAPRRIRLLQYAVTSNLTSADWARVLSAATRSFSALGTRHRRAVSQYPGLAEPFAVIAPTTWQHNPCLLRDAEGLPLPLATARGASRAAALRNFAGDRTPEIVAGRVIDSEGVLLLLPCSAAVRSDRSWRMMRIT